MVCCQFVRGNQEPTIDSLVGAMTKSIIDGHVRPELLLQRSALTFLVENWRKKRAAEK